MNKIILGRIGFLAAVAWFILSERREVRNNPPAKLTAARKKEIDDIALTKYSGYNSIWKASEAAAASGDIDGDSLWELDYFLDAVKPHTYFTPPRREDSCSMDEWVEEQRKKESREKDQGLFDLLRA